LENEPLRILLRGHGGMPVFQFLLESISICI
jgi:hypothetical protein